jgi:hypothetical protein
MLPTRAESVANTERPWRGSNGRKCFISRAGPTAFTVKALAMWAASRSRQLFSGAKPSL